MNTDFKKLLCTVLALTLVLSLAAACGSSDGATPTDDSGFSDTPESGWQSMAPEESETPFLEGDDLGGFVEEVIGEGREWNGSFDTLTDKDRADIQTALDEKGYDAVVTDKGIVYKNFPDGLEHPDDAEMTAVVKDALGDDYQWNNSFADMSENDLKSVEKEMRRRGYDVSVTNDGVVYNQSGKTATDELVEELVPELHGWDGDYSRLSDEVLERIEEKLKEYGMDAEITRDGPIINKPVEETTLPSQETTTAAPEKDGDEATTAAPAPATKLTGASLSGVGTFGGSSDDRFVAVAATSDGGYAAVGNFNSINGDYEGVNPTWLLTKSSVVKFAADGSFVWKQMIGGNKGFTLSAVTELADGSIVAVGNTFSTNIDGESTVTFPAGTDTGVDAVVVKFSAQGERLWLKYVKGSEGEYFSSVSATPDGGFVAGGKVQSGDGDFDGLPTDKISACLIKFDGNGTIYWKRALSGSMHSDMTAIDVNASGEIFAVCESLSTDGNFASLGGLGSYDSYVIKLNRSGKVLWTKALSGKGVDEYLAVACTADGGCIAAGAYTVSLESDGIYEGIHNYGASDGAVVKLNSAGGIDFISVISGLEVETLTGITALNGGYAVVGHTKSANMSFRYLGNKGETDCFLWLLDSKGKEISLTSPGGSGEDKYYAVDSVDGINLAAVGGTKSTDGGFKGLTPASNGSNTISGIVRYKADFS